MRKLAISFSAVLSALFSVSQPVQDTHLSKKDSTLRAVYKQDSLKIEKEFAMEEKMANLMGKAEYPVFKGGGFSGVIPVSNPTEIPDPNQDYKLLFEWTLNNPDSAAKEINHGLDEIARIINLHVASGIPLKRIMPVVVAHGAALYAMLNEKKYQDKYHTENPNIKFVDEIKKVANAKFIACGQAMAFLELKPEDIIPGTKVSVTAQTVLSNYQLKGYVLYAIADEKK